MGIPCGVPLGALGNSQDPLGNPSVEPPVPRIADRGVPLGASLTDRILEADATMGLENTGWGISRYPYLPR